MYSIDFNAIEKGNSDWRCFAKETFSPGIDPAELKPGMKVTISPNLTIRDRSGTTEIHTVVAVNCTHVQMIGSDNFWKGRPRIWLIHEHYFYDASLFSEDPDDGTA